MTTSPRLQTRVPTPVLGRWLLRSGIVLPVPLTAMHVARLPLAVDDVAELTAPRIAGSATPAQLEALPAPTAAALDAVEDLLSDPTTVAYATHTDRPGGATRTLGALLRGRRAVVIEDTATDVTVLEVAAHEVADTLARRLATRPAAFRPVDVPTAVLAAVAADPSRGSVEAALRRAGLAPDALDVVRRVQADVRAFGVVGAVPVGRPGREPVLGDWYAGPAGAILKHAGGPHTLRFEPADRAALTRLLAAAVAAA